MIDVRCKNCGVLQLKAHIFIGAIKCKSCKMIFEYNVRENNLFVTNQFDMKSTNGIIPSESHETTLQDAATTSVKSR